MDGDCRIRLASPADAEELSRLERRCFSDPWSPAGFQEVLASPGGFGLVVEQGKQLVAYMLGRQLLDEGEILNLAVIPERRRRGLGRALLDASLKAFVDRGVTQVFLEVRGSNRAAQRLYYARGFQPVGHRPDYYRHPAEDALVLRLGLTQLA
jgi:ribosomal-protein-alanine N-acetyltransferase